MLPQAAHRSWACADMESHCYEPRGGRACLLMRVAPAVAVSSVPQQLGAAAAV